MNDLIMFSHLGQCSDAVVFIMMEFFLFKLIDFGEILVGLDFNLFFVLFFRGCLFGGMIVSIKFFSTRRTPLLVDYNNMVQEIDGFKGVMGSREILKSKLSSSIGYGCLFILCIGIDQFEKDVYSHCYYRFMP